MSNYCNYHVIIWPVFSQVQNKIITQNYSFETGFLHLAQLDLAGLFQVVSVVVIFVFMAIGSAALNIYIF